MSIRRRGTRAMKARGDTIDERRWVGSTVEALRGRGGEKPGQRREEYGGGGQIECRREKGEGNWP